LREARGELPGLLCACACSLYINKKKISVVKLQQFFGDEVRGAPPGLLCVSACVGENYVELYRVCCAFLLVN